VAKEKAKKYGYKPNRPHPSLPADKVGGELERIREDAGELTPKAVVDASRPPQAVLHRELDLHVPPKERAELWSRHRARNLISVVTIIPVKKEGEEQKPATAAYVNVTVGPAAAPESRSYEPIAEVMADPLKRAAYVQRALEKLVRVQREFRHLQELASVWAAIDEVVVSGS
jgi:hypothetical protein